ncbi:SMI1/KNR4 family protein [Kitasatospora sp. NPDC094015]|uniref:SMI1/KNR4 family protein n=1 Tax=Kitasatospora sp. NPDC094015 TaxID=3155205 RepID=UPI00332BBADA
MRDYVSLVAAMLGEPGRRRSIPARWQDLESALGVELPGDFKGIVEMYAPVQVNGHLILWHPNTGLFNLAERVNRNVDTFRSIDWSASEALFRGEVPRFGAPDGLIPVAGADRGETIFLAKSKRLDIWHVVGFSSDGESFHEYEMGFSEWLYRYFIGEEMIGPGSAAFYPGPLLVEDLPQSRGEMVARRHGPGRGM